MTAPSVVIMRLDPGSTTAAAANALRSGALVARVPAGVIDLSGPGAVACMQGLLTNDLEKPGDGAFVYGALLTPKGMIVTDGWVTRLGETVRIVVPPAGRERAVRIFSRSIPPRLARSLDRTAELTVLRLAGAHSLALAEAARLSTPPAPGRVIATPDGDVARIPEALAPPFVLQIVTETVRADALVARLGAAGVVIAEPAALELARVLAGWPALGSEIDEKTIPQEVRFDEVGGVSYTKGCYTGQETVSRLHFRGHTNRRLQGVVFDAAPAREDPLPVFREDQEVGRVTSIVWVPDAGRWLGLALVRREVEPGTLVRAGEVEARVVSPPLALLRHDPA